MAHKTVVWTIGELSMRSGCNVETIRYYEKIGLLPAPPRSAGGHRLYCDEQAQRLRFVRRGRDLGFAIDDLRALLRLADERAYNCSQVKAITTHHLREVKTKIRDLRRLERTLARIESQCSGGVKPACPIIEVLFAEDGANGRSRQRRACRPGTGRSCA